MWSSTTAAARLAAPGCVKSSQRNTGARCLHIASASLARSATQRSALAPPAAPAPPRTRHARQDRAEPKPDCLPAPVVEQAFHARHPALVQALASIACDAPPAAAARLLHDLEAELPPALTDVAASGDCVLVVVAPGLLPLLERATECLEQGLSAGRLEEATRTGKTLLSLLCRLRFGSRASAAGYHHLATRCKLALKAAYDAGAEIRQEDIVDLETACSRSSPWLWLTPYFGHRCASAVDDYITQGWADGELAVRFTEAYCSLTGRGRYTQVTSKFVRLVRAALQHPLSAKQLLRLQAAASRLPIEMRLAMEVHARTEPADCWYAALTARLQEQKEAAADAAAASTAVGSPAHQQRARVHAVHAAPAVHVAPRGGDTLLNGVVAIAVAARGRQPAAAA